LPCVPAPAAFTLGALFPGYSPPPPPEPPAKAFPPPPDAPEAPPPPPIAVIELNKEFEPFVPTVD
jgi:hypothetical protein